MTTNQLNVSDLISILEQQIVVLKERAKEHGAFDMFQRAANNLGRQYTKAELAGVLAAVKLARLEGNPYNIDSLIDFLNYICIKAIFDVNELRRQHAELERLEG